MFSYRKNAFFVATLFVSVLLASPQDESSHKSVESESCQPGDELCENKYVEEVFASSEDCEIPTPEIVEPSELEVFGREWGIYFGYKYHAYKYWIGAASVCLLCYLIKRRCQAS